MNNKEDMLENYTCEGKILDIFTYPAPILSKKASPIEVFNDELRELCKNMLYTMYHAPGIGLAAPQVGKGIRLFVLDVDYNREEVTRPDGSEEFHLSDFKPMVFINPVIKNKEGELLYEEGCLSVPGIYENVKRAESITIDFQDMFGEHHSLDASGVLSVCIQHENDHLDGIVFLDRLSPLKKNFYKKKIIKQSKKDNF